MRQRPSHLGKDFRPQPFEQLIKVLREMGHDADARQIAMLKHSFLHKRKKFPEGALRLDASAGCGGSPVAMATGRTG